MFSLFSYAFPCFSSFFYVFLCFSMFFSLFLLVFLFFSMFRQYPGSRSLVGWVQGPRCVFLVYSRTTIWALFAKQQGHKIASVITTCTRTDEEPCIPGPCATSLPTFKLKWLELEQNALSQDGLSLSRLQCSSPRLASATGATI